MGTVAVPDEVAVYMVNASEWERTRRQAELSMQLWVAMLGAVDAAGMGMMIPGEIRELVSEVSSL